MSQTFSTNLQTRSSIHCKFENLKYYLPKFPLELVNFLHPPTSKLLLHTKIRIQQMPVFIFENISKLASYVCAIT